MSRMLSWAATMGDWVNPVAVKECRQAVQNRLVITILMLFLLINLTIIGGYLVLWPSADTSTTGGPAVFGFLLSILLMTCAGFVPLYTGVRIALEHNNANLDLLFITTISPGAIIRGKFLAAMALTLLIYSVCMPFITFTYLLRGIDLPTIVFVLAGGFLLCTLANSGGIFVGCIQGSWFVRGVGAFVMFMSLFFLTISIIEAAQFGALTGFGGIVGTWQFWAGAGTVLLLALLMIGLFHVLAVAMVSPNTCNRMLVPRLYIMACWFLTGILAVLYTRGMTSLEPLMIWVIGCGVGFSLLTVMSLGERDTWSNRIRRTIPRNRVLRFFAFLLYTGSAGGILWYSLLFAATMLIAGFVRGSLPSSVMVHDVRDFSQACEVMLYIFGYALCYCLTIAVLRLGPLKNVDSRHLTAATAFLAIVVYLLPCLIAFLTVRNWWYQMPWCLLGSPIVLTTGNDAAIAVARFVVSGWLATVLLLTVPWWNRQWRLFTHYECEEPREAILVPAEAQTS